jgi:hypothetical protein
MVLPVVALAAVMTASSNNVVAIPRITSSSNAFRLLQSWYGAFLIWPTVGLCCLPLLAVSPSIGKKEDTATRRIVVYGALLILFGVLAVQSQRGVFNLIPGDYLGPARLGPVHVRGTKPVIFHPLLLGPLLLLAGFAAWAEAVSIGRHLASSMQPAAAILVAFAVSQALVLAISSTSDRYYLPVAAPLVILLAGRIGRLGSRAAGLRAATALAIFVGCLYLPGELDYQAWQAARSAAVQPAYSVAPPSRVDAGYEANGLFWELPLYDSTGSLPARDPETPILLHWSSPRGRSPCTRTAVMAERPALPYLPTVNAATVPQTSQHHIADVQMARARR